MISFLKKFAEKISVDIIYLEGLEEDGCYVPEHDAIFIRPDLSEYEEIQVLSHELAHASKHKNIFDEYRDSYVSHCKAENEADVEAVKVSLLHYLSNIDITDASQINWINFMNCYHINYSLEPIVKKWMPVLYKLVCSRLFF